ncbi:ABC transporter ATP-binding protein [Streptomyces sp. NPDC021100]|uniref:ABC transporter ATP-binding protein n=1 Tax=Streptomyces sp. NPDC021100 TaxID=3365114 RepID=UPI0037B90660
MTTSTDPQPPIPARPRRTLLPWPRRRRPTTEPLPQYTVSAERHDHALDDSFLTIARRLPTLSTTALRLAWAADRRAFLLTAALQVLSGVLTATGLHATAGVLAPLFASGATADRLRAAVPSLILIGAAASARSVISALTVATTARIGPKVDGIAERRYLDAATRVPLAAYDDPAWCDQSEAASRAAKDAHLMVDNLTTVLTTFMGLLAAAGVLSLLHPLLMPLLLLAVLPRGWAAVRTARTAYLADRHVLADRRLRHTWMFHTSGRPTALEVRAGTMRTWLLDRFTTVTARLEDHAARVGRTSARYLITGDALAGTCTVGVYATLIWLTSTGRVPLAAAGTAVIAVQTSQRLLTQLVTGVNGAYKTGLYLGDWTDFLTDAAARTPTPLTQAPLARRLEVIEARDVSFTYAGASHPALQGVSVRIRRGEVLAVVGANGSGKSTLAKVLAGLYAPTTGTVTWDGISLADVDPDQAWSRLAMLPQDFARWPVTARENITLGQGPGDDEAVLAAAHASGADTVLQALPDGLDTNLAPSWWGGRDLSGGQWQRIAGARAFYRADAELLICDEPTAALDPRGEEAVYDRIRTLSEGRSVVLITHRLGSTRNADRIIVLDDGHLIEEGTHETLMELDGEYAAMYRTQARTYSDPVT